MSSNRNRKKIWIIVAVIVLIGGLVGANLKIKRDPKGKEVDVEYVKVDSLVQSVSASGKIQPTVDVNISANVSGRISYLGAQEGDPVEKGQLLVKIEDENYKASLEMSQYALASAEASLQEAKSSLKRITELHDSDLTSDADLEAAQAVLKRLEAEVDRARATVDQAEDALAKTRIYSPLDGRVTRLNKEEGEMAIGATFSTDVIMVVGQLDQMEVNVEVNENDVILISQNDKVEIEVFALPDTSYSGVVTEIAHSGIIRGQGTAEEVTNFEVKVLILDAIENIRPGMSATVEIITDSRDKTLVVPQEAVAVRSLDDEMEKEKKANKEKKKGLIIKVKKDETNNKPDKSLDNDDLVEVVYIAKNDTAWVRQVTLGINSDTHFEILSGIEENDIVITGPFRQISRELHSGDRIKYDEPEKDDKPSSDKDEKAEK